MNRAHKRRQQKLANKKSRSKKTTQNVTADDHPYFLKGVSLHQAGQLEQAIHWYKETIKLQPKNAAALNNLGLALHILGRSDKAVPYLQAAIAIWPNFPEAYFCLGNALNSLGNIYQAIECLKKSISLKDDYPSAYNNCGNALIKIGQYEEGIDLLEKAAFLQSDFVEAHSNLGNAYTKHGQLEKAIASLQTALLLEPKSFFSYENLGNAYKHQGKLHEAVASFKKAIEFRPHFAATIDNFSFTLDPMCYDSMAGLADLESLNIDHLLEIIPKPVEVYRNQQKSITHINPDKEYEHCNSVELAIVKYRLLKIAGYETLEERNNVMKKLPPIEYETVVNKQKRSAPAIIGSEKHERKGMVAMLGIASAGSGLFHSLLDNHPEISTMPGVYMSGYFGRGVWQNIVKGGYSGIPANFSEMYEVLFDARDKRTPPPPHIGDVYAGNIGTGIAEGFCTMGENMDTHLSLDRETFLRNLSDILAVQESVDHGSFFEYAHHAYEKTLGNNFQKKKIILHHLHKYDPFSMCTLLKNFPTAKLLTIIRDPVQGCESWTRRAMQSERESNGFNRYLDAVSRLAGTIKHIDTVEFSMQDSVGIRLEDIKRDPPGTMRRLSAWLGIDYSETMHEATMQGLKWWGDPGSSLFGKTQTEDHGKEEPIRRKIGIFFSEQDRYILETLFYPFSERFGYIESNPDRFKKDLQDIRPLLEKPLDFEKSGAEEFPDDYPELEASTPYKTLHTTLLGRWRVLNRERTYPDMFKPLPD
ncbi:MAG: tetratricopeptide repeat protein [Magnetococcales bacterium]|nr:tetratricopeptide repeat protein [Magnetococcales bacterium]